MGAVVMPAAVIAVIAAPFGLDWLPFQVVGLGMGYIIAVAEFVAGLGGAVVGVPAGPPAALGLIVARRARRRALDRARALGRARADGARARALGRARAAGHPDRRQRPAVRHPHRRRGGCSRATEGNGYAAESWLEDDGDLATQAEAHARGGLERRKQPDRDRGAGARAGCSTSAASDAPTAEADCAAAAILIAPNWQRAPAGPLPLRRRRRGCGATARWRSGSRRRGPEVEGARAVNRGRPWTARSRRAAAAASGRLVRTARYTTHHFRDRIGE